MSELHTVEEGVGLINLTGLPDAQVQQSTQKLARELASWVQGIRRSQSPSIFNRAAYIAPDNPFAIMETCYSAVEHDDVIGGVCDVSEGLMLQGLKWEADNADDADIFNQLSRDLNLDSYVRQWHREDYTYSQVITGMWWGRKTYTVRGKTLAGKKRKKVYNITCPVALTVLNPMLVVPLSPGPFGQDRLTWHATEEEYSWLVAEGDSQYFDSVAKQFITSPVDIKTLSTWELQELTRWGVVPQRLFNLNPDTVFRSARTRVAYQRFPTFRLKSTFPILDMKQQLSESDRVTLVGSVNYIMLVKQGSKEEPALPEEINNLKDNFRSVAKVPVIIGDHRLAIEIITPNQDQALKAERWDTVDRRLLARALGALAVASNGQRSETTLTLARNVARMLENRRHMLKREMEEHIARAIVNHPDNAGIFEEEPNLVFTPRNIQLDSDAQIVQAILALRTQKELSRESTLEYFGFDETTEASRRQFEKDSGLDDLFGTIVPFAAPDVGGPDAASGGSESGGSGSGSDYVDDGGTESSQVSGARGGRPKGGGTPKKSVQGSVKPRSSNGNASV